LQDAQAIFDGQARGNDEEPSAEVLAAGMAHRIDRPPRDEHGITVVLPVPVANFNARRISSGLASPDGGDEMYGVRTAGWFAA
jgi:hypothetical protein